MLFLFILLTVLLSIVNYYFIFPCLVEREREKWLKMSPYLENFIRYICTCYTQMPHVAVMLILPFFPSS